MSILALTALSVGLATGVPVNNEEIEYKAPLGVVAEWNFDNGIKLYGGVENGDLRISDQPDTKTWVYELGAGYQYNFTDTWFMFGGLGYAWTSPNDQKFDSVTPQTTIIHSLDNGMTARIGGGVNIGERWTVNLYYNYFKPDARTATVDFDSPAVSFDNDIDMSQIKASVMFNF